VPRTKLSIVRYLNSVPLAWGVQEGPQAEFFDAVLSTPAECADQLAAGAVDIGLIPSIEFHNIKGCRIVPGPAIACRHRVRSVLLVSQLPLWKIRTVAVDRGSRSSVALARIIFDEFCGIRPDFRSSDPDLTSMLAQSDAALIIGDVALQFMAENERPNAEKQKSLLRLGPEPLEVFDLVERWKMLTGLPFVFAFWAARQGFRDTTAVEKLKESRDYGVAHTAEIASRYAATLSLPENFVRDYLERNVYYYMDETCLEGLNAFYKKAARIGAIKTQRALEFL
jgi:chorismate dehydratase